MHRIIPSRDLAKTGANLDFLGPNANVMISFKYLGRLTPSLSQSNVANSTQKAIQFLLMYLPTLVSLLRAVSIRNKRAGC